MSWHYLQEQEEASWEANSLDGAPPALLSLMPTAAGSCSPDSGTASCRDSRSGTMCRPSTESRGAEASMWSAVDFLAPTSVPPAKEPESPASSQDCGAKWRELSVKYDRNTSSWRTAHCLLNEDLPWSSVTLPKWGMMRAGELLALAPSELSTGETGSGSLATPTARDWKDCGTKTAPPSRPKHSQQTLGQQLGVKIGLAPQPAFAEWMLGWPIEWTDLKPLGTDKFQQWQHSHGICSQKN